MIKMKAKASLDIITSAGIMWGAEIGKGIACDAILGIGVALSVVFLICGLVGWSKD